jgi:RNA polymerase sigma factor (sigma-70 family)
VKRAGAERHYEGVKVATIERRDALEEPLRRYLETGDEAAMEEIVAGTRGRLLAAARRIGSPQDAEDAVQAAYLSLVRRRGTPFEAPVVAWLLTAVVRIAYRRKAVLRREDRIAERLAREPGSGAPRAEAVSREDLDRLRREVARLPARYRDPVVLHHFQGLSTVEAARILDLPEATVRTRLRRARLLVRARWSPRFVAAAMSVPWLVSDAWHAAPSGALAAAGGGAMKGVGVGLAAAVGLVAAAVGVFVGSRWVGPAGEGSGRVERLEADLQEARQALAARDAEVARLRSEEAARLATAPPRETPAPARGSESPAAPPEPEPARTAARSPKEPRFSFPSAGGALETVDWQEVGTNLAAMPPLMEHLARELAKGTPIQSIPEIGTIQQHNGPLVKMAFQLTGKLSGHGPNGTFTHPYVQANAIAAALEAAKMPLTPSQADALEAIARRSGEAEAARIAGYREDEMALRKLLDEADARQRFYDEAFEVLTPAQRDTLRPEATRGLLQGDLFSSGLVWAQYAQALPFTDDETLVASMEQKVVVGFGVPDDRRASARGLVREWADAFPPEALAADPGPLSALGSLSLAQVRRAAENQLALQRSLERSGLDDGSVKKIRAYEVVHVPYRPKAE